MSELTPCNRCTLNEMQRQAAERGVEVIVEVEHPPHELAGWIAVRYADRNEPSAYFMALPDECAC